MYPEASVKTIFEVAPNELLMATEAAIRGMRAGNGSPAAATVQTVLDRSRDAFIGCARPSGLYQSLSAEEFDTVYRGAVSNHEDTPLEQVVEDAVALALFAVTLGQEISDRISALFDAGELAEGYVLDQVASFAADELATIAGRRFRAAHHPPDDLVVLPYSPGYCGWHVAGQRPLFAHLKPEEIGISLNDSYLMQPIKSVSGVLVLAPIEAHAFSPAFPCCATCTTLTCQERIAGLRDT